MKPTDEQIIKCLAEAEGWTEIEPCTCWDHVLCGYEPERGAHKKHIPDYLNDLNAVARVREKLAQEQHDEYINNMCLTIIAPAEAEYGVMSDTDAMYVLLNATPRQHALALARTLKPELFK